MVDWGSLYKNVKITEMPWYNPDLDKDVQNVLDQWGLHSGTFLDLGTGPATQANKLAERGFEVTGVDLSEDAILLAKQAYKNIEFIQDDIINSKLSKKFDYILDRGCFHVIDVDKRETYARNVYRLLNDSGILFLKGFSNKMPETGIGPHRLSEQILKDTFGSYFNIEEIRETEFTNETNPRNIRALFAVMRKK